MAKSLETLISEANQRLKVARCGLTIELRGDRLALRGTLPPKPGSLREEPYSQRISTGIRANVQGIKFVEAEAMKIAGLVAQQKFDWHGYIDEENYTIPSMPVLLEKFEADYFSSREDNPKTRSTWKKEFLDVFNKLPEDKKLSASLILSIVQTTAPNTRIRKRYCQTLGRLAQFAGINIDLKPYQGNYGLKDLNPKDVPEDSLIRQWWEKIPNPSWRLAYGIMATFGIRPSELIYLDRSELPKLIVTDGKTGRREAYPIPNEWWQEWKLNEGELPQISAPSGSALTDRVRVQFNRYGVPFHPQSLRHAYCIRGILYGLPGEIGAAWAGHGIEVHNRVYQRWIKGETHRRVYERYILGG